MRGNRALLALLVAVGMTAAACTTVPTTVAPSPAARESHAPRTPTGTATAASPATARRSLVLLPVPCTHRSVRLVPGGYISPATGEQAQSFEVRLVGTAPCSLWGSPVVRLRDRHGAVLPFAYVHRSQYTSNAPPSPVVLRPGHPAVFLVAKYRCDVTRFPRYAAGARVTLPYVRGGYDVPLAGRRSRAIPLCGKGDPPQNVVVSPLRGGYRQLYPLAKPPARPSYAVSLRSPYGPPDGASYGRGDLNGDGRPDLVVVRTSGLVTARVSGLGLRTLRLARDQTLRLQAITTLGQGRSAYVLVAGTAIGCCGGYALGQTGTEVIGLSHGRLREVQRAGRPWPVAFSNGHGDYYAGLTCSTGVVTQVEVHQTGPDRLVVRRTRYRLSGLEARVVSRDVGHAAGRLPEGLRLSRSSCPGMDARGWDSLGYP